MHLGQGGVSSPLAKWNVSSGRGGRLRRSITEPAIASFAMALVLAFTEAAGAAVCPPAGAPWLRVAFGGDGFEPGLRARVMEQLGADLGGHRVALCEATEATDGESPLADIALSLAPGPVLSLEVRDAVTDKRLARDLPLASLPRDALALSIALAAEELLHASWIEAALAPPDTPSPRAPQKPVPRVVREINAAEIAHMPEVASTTPGLTAQAALLAAAQYATGGQADFGADARFSWGGRLALSARAGFRLAPDVPSAHGSVSGRELLAGLGLDYALVPRDAAWGADVGLRADFLDVQFAGVAAQGAQSMSGSKLAAVVGGTLGGWIQIHPPWRLVAETLVGTPVHAVTASDSGSTTTGVSGVVLGFELGVGATLSK
jgi:hypothetical protein